MAHCVSKLAVKHVTTSSSAFRKNICLSSIRNFQSDLLYGIVAAWENNYVQSPLEITMNEFIFDQEIITSNIPLRFTIISEDNVYIIKNDTYNIASFGRTIEEAKKQISKKVFFIWDEVIAEDDSKLSFDNIERKRNLSKILSKL